MFRPSRAARWSALVLVGLTACGGDDPTGPSGSQSLAFVFEGTTYDVGKALAAPADFFGQPGLRVYLARSASATCADVSPILEGASVFFPQSGGGYGQPKEVYFWMGGGSTSESSASGYPGAITSVGATTVSGWVKALGVGLNSDSSIDVTFTATLC